MTETDEITNTLSLENALIQAKHSANAYGRQFYVTSNDKELKVVDCQKFSSRDGCIERIVWPEKR